MFYLKLSTYRKGLQKTNNKSYYQVCFEKNFFFIVWKSFFLCEKNLVDGIITEDTDVLAYGAPIYISGLKTDGSCTEIIYNNVLKEVEMNKKSFLDFCIERNSKSIWFDFA